MTSQQIASRPGCCNAKLTQVKFAYDFEAKTGLVAGQYITEATIDVLYRFVCLVSYRPRQQLGYIADRSQDWRRKILRAATYETEWGDHDFLLSRSHYTGTDPTSRERAASTGIEPRTSSPGDAHSTD